jgi:hypothetical protein
MASYSGWIRELVSHNAVAVLPFQPSLAVESAGRSTGYSSATPEQALFMELKNNNFVKIHGGNNRGNVVIEHLNTNHLGVDVVVKEDKYSQSISL